MAVSIPDAAEGDSTEANHAAPLLLLIVSDPHHLPARPLLPAADRSQVLAVHVERTPRQTRRMQRRWAECRAQVPLVVLADDGGSVDSIVRYARALDADGSSHRGVVLVMEEPSGWLSALRGAWEAVNFRLALLGRKGIRLQTAPAGALRLLES